MKTLGFVWVIESFKDGAWLHLGMRPAREDARVTARWMNRIYGHKTRIVKFIRSEG